MPSVGDYDACNDRLWNGSKWVDYSEFHDARVARQQTGTANMAINSYGNLASGMLNDLLGQGYSQYEQDIIARKLAEQQRAVEQAMMTQARGVPGTLRDLRDDRENPVLLLLGGSE